MEDNASSQDDIQLLIRLAKENVKTHALLYVKAAISMVLVSLTVGATALIMKYIVNEFVEFRDVYRIWIVAAIVALIFMVKGFASYFQNVFLSRAGNSIIADQQRKIYDRLVKQEVSFFQENAGSDLLLRITNSAQSARNIIDLLITSYVRDALSLVALVSVMIWTNYWLSLVVILSTPILFLSVRFLVQKIKQIVQKEMNSLSDIIQVVQETSMGIRVIKAFHLENYMANRMNKAIRDVEERSNAISRLQAITSPVMEGVVGLSVSLVIGISGTIILHSQGSAGDLMAFVSSILLAYEPARRLSNSRIQIGNGMVGVRMMFQILDHPITLKEEKSAKALDVSEGKISFQDVSFHYSAEEPLLKNFNLEIPAQKMTALVGPSGSGKSTLINLIMRLYDPVSGKILIDGQDIRFATFASLRHHLSYVGQDIFLFRGTVHHNIAIGKENATKEEIIEAAKNANAHEFIMKLPQGYDTEIVDNGGNLSGGQRQRLAIARAMLRDSKILLFDEATSALDAETEALIREALERLTKNRTTIMIAHRFSSIARADHIIVMQAGAIVEQGSQNQLLQNNGLYQKLYNLQYKNMDDNQSLEDLALDITQGSKVL